MVEVVAALVWQYDKFMICQRPADEEILKELIRRYFY